MGGHGFFGGGYHGSRITYYRSGYGRGGGGGGGCGCGCCCCNFSFLRIVWGLSFLLLVLIYIIISATYPKSSDKRTELSLSETRIISFSPTWYERISGSNVAFGDITGNTSYINTGTVTDDVQLMRFNSRPPLTNSDSWVLAEPLVPISSYDFYYWSWYFYEGSTVQTSWSYNFPITVYFIRSVKGYDAYYDDSDSVGSYILRQQRSSTGNLTFTANADDIFFVIFENWDLPSGVRGNANFSIYSKLLNVSEPAESCLFPCGMNVPLKSDSVYVLYTPTVSSYAAQGKGSANSVFTFNLHKSSRVWFIVVICYLVPLGGILLIVLMIVAFHKRAMCFSHSSSKPAELDNMAAVNPTGPPPETPVAPYSSATPFSSEPYPTAYPNPTPAYPSAQPPSPLAPYPPQPASPYPPQPSQPPVSPYPPAAAYTPQPPPPSAFPPSDAYTPTTVPPNTSPYPPNDYAPATAPPSSSSPFPPANSYTPNPPSPSYNPEYQNPSYPPPSS